MLQRACILGGSVLLLACSVGSQAPAVKTGTDSFKKELVLTSTDIGDIRSISTVYLKADPKLALIVMGNSGAVYATRAGEVRKSVKFESRMMHPLPINIDGDELCEFMDQGGGWQPVSLLDSRGKEVWRYNGPATPDQMAVGDLDRDNRLEFVIGMNGAGGVIKVDDQGNKAWAVGASNAFSVAIVDTNGDGLPEIVHSDGMVIRIRNASGEEIRTLQPGFQVFSTVPWPNTGDPRLLLGKARDGLRVVDFQGSVMAQFDGTGLNSFVEGTPVTFLPGFRYFAVASTIRATERRSLLKIYGPARTLVYEEEFPSAYLALSVLTDHNSQQLETLLVGSGSNVWALKPSI